MKTRLITTGLLCVAMLWAGASAAQLRSIPAVKLKAPPNAKAGEKPTAPYLDLVVPK